MHSNQKSVNAELKEQWNKRYQLDTYVYGTRVNDFLRKFHQLIPSGKVLCLGEGEGRNAVYLAGKGFQVTAVDISEVGLLKAQHLAQKRRVRIETVSSDLMNYEIGLNRWQGIVSIFCHLPSEIRRDIHRRVVKGLAPHGIFVLESYTPDQLKYRTGGPPTEDLLVSLEELREELRPLTIRHGIEKLRIVREGHLHTGKAAVVQVVAEKSK